MFDDLLKKRKFTRQEKAIIYVVKTLNELSDMGILEGKAFTISKEGLEAIEGFEPTSEEIKNVMEMLANEGYIR